MFFTSTPLPGVYLVDIDAKTDERGLFARTWCREEFQQRGLNPALAQCSISFNRRQGTLRGMHYQAAPRQETKLVRCVRGAIYDVVVDLRPESPTHRRWFGVELTGENRRALYVPEGLAHGFLTLADDSEVFYQISESFDPALARGVRWNDPAFGISWPAEPLVMADRDRSYEDYRS